MYPMKRSRSRSGAGAGVRARKLAIHRLHCHTICIQTNQPPRNFPLRCTNSSSHHPVAEQRHLIAWGGACRGPKGPPASGTPGTLLNSARDRAGDFPTPNRPTEVAIRGVRREPNASFIIAPNETITSRSRSTSTSTRSRNSMILAIPTNHVVWQFAG